MENGFSHRFNLDGSIDSICHRCFATIGTAFQEADLERLEEVHACNPEEELRFHLMAEEAKLHN